MSERKISDRQLLLFMAGVLIFGIGTFGRGCVAESAVARLSQRLAAIENAGAKPDRTEDR